MAKPKCPWKIPFKVVVPKDKWTTWKVVDAKGEGVSWHGKSRRMAEADCYALNAAYPVKRKRKGGK